MKKVLLMIIAFPMLAFAAEPEGTRVTNLEVYNLAVRRLDIKRSAKSIFALNYEDSAFYSNFFLTEVAGDIGSEIKFKEDSRRLIAEILAWQKSNGARSSEDYVEDVYKGRSDTKTFDWAVRREEVILDLSERYETRKVEYQARLNEKVAAARKAAIRDYWNKRFFSAW